MISLLTHLFSHWSIPLTKTKCKAEEGGRHPYICTVGLGPSECCVLINDDFAKAAAAYQQRGLQRGKKL